MFIRQDNGYKKCFRYLFLFSWMGKLHKKLRKLGWGKVHRFFCESEDVHVGFGWGGIDGQVEKEEDGVGHGKGRREAKEL